MPVSRRIGEGLPYRGPLEPEQVTRRGRIRTRLFVAGLAGVAALSLGAVTLNAVRDTGGARVRFVRAASAEGVVGRKAPATAVNAFPELPGIGARYGSRLPADTSQAVVAVGRGVNQDTTAVEFFQKAAGGWRLEGTWHGHNGHDGWTRHKISGDLRSPVGVFALTDAGGDLPEPTGTRLPYEHSPLYEDYGTGFFGESLRGTFGYVIAIGYNRVPGSSPMSTVFPLGPGLGGGVWMHIDRGGPTRGCVSIPKQAMATLLETLNPADHPVIVMGDRADLASD